MAGRHATIEEVAEAIQQSQGNLAAAGRKLGIGRSAVLQRCQKSPTLQAIREECKESMKDHAESSLHKAVLNGEGWAVCFYLKTQAKDRGYIERQEIKNLNDDDLNKAINEELEKLATSRQSTTANGVAQS